MNRGNATFIVIIIALFVLGLIAVFAISGFGIGQNLFTNKTTESVGPQVPSDSQVDDLNSQSNSDEISAIEKDINDTNLDSLDEGLDEVNKLLQP